MYLSAISADDDLILDQLAAAYGPLHGDAHLDSFGTFVRAGDAIITAPPGFLFALILNEHGDNVLYSLRIDGVEHAMRRKVVTDSLVGAPAAAPASQPKKPATTTKKGPGRPKKAEGQRASRPTREPRRVAKWGGLE